MGAGGSQFEGVSGVITPVLVKEIVDYGAAAPKGDFCGWRKSEGNSRFTGNHSASQNFFFALER
jgi:hypothetical protein